MYVRLITAAVAAVAALILFACKMAEGDYSETDRAYWFTVAVKRFVPFRKSAYDGKGNLDEAGTYYEFVLRDDFSGRISVLTGGYSMSACTDLSVNGFPVTGSSSVPEFSVTFEDLILNKGDRLTFHSRFLYEEDADAKGFTIETLRMENEKGCFDIKNPG